MLAKARQMRVEPRAQLKLGDLDCDIEDVFACLTLVEVGEIWKEEPDLSVHDKLVYVFRKQYDSRVLYLKVSIRLPKDHDLKVLSFKGWGESNG